MELKDVILSTLAEMEEKSETEELSLDIEKNRAPIEEFEEAPQDEVVDEVSSSVESEMLYLNSIRERLLVLFEGFQAPNNTNIEAKVDMTLNFLEYVLSTIDTRVEALEKGNR